MIFHGVASILDGVQSVVNSSRCTLLFMFYFYYNSFFVGNTPQTPHSVVCISGYSVKIKKSELSCSLGSLKIFVLHFTWADNLDANIVLYSVTSLVTTLTLIWNEKCRKIVINLAEKIKMDNRYNWKVRENESFKNEVKMKMAKVKKMSERLV
jgi:hypothetical protein